MTLDEEIEFWKAATESARTKELAFITFGIRWGLCIAKDDYMQKRPSFVKNHHRA